MPELFNNIKMDFWHDVFSSIGPNDIRHRAHLMNEMVFFSLPEFQRENNSVLIVVSGSKWRGEASFWTFFGIF